MVKYEMDILTGFVVYEGKWLHFYFVFMPFLRTDVCNWFISALRVHSEDGR